MTIKVSNLSASVPIVDADGLPTPYWVQNFNSTIANLVSALNQVIAAQNAATVANAAAATANAAATSAATAAASANTAATTANTAATTAQNTTNVASSYVTPSNVLTATDAGANATISISAHTRTLTNGTTISVNSGSVTALAYSTGYWIYYDDPSFAGGAVTYNATTTQATAAQTGSRFCVGAITTPAHGAGGTSGKVVTPPGSGTALP